jgi:aryl-alcohol dehydrogenase-like predicted oxidoreductase
MSTQSFQIPKITIGGNVFGWTLNEKDSYKILDAFVANGLNFIDTADMYSTWVSGNKGGESETIIGNWLKKHGRRDDILIATKLGFEVDGKKGLNRERVREAAEASLRRLSVDYIDLYISHVDDENTPVAETMEAFNELIKEGKVRNIGASNLSASRIAESIEYTESKGLKSYISIQTQYNLYDRQELETEYLSLIQSKRLITTPYYALASGFLSGKYRTEADFSQSPRGGGIKEQYFNKKGKKILAALDQVSEETKAPQSAIAIAWQLHKPFITSPIASATTLKQVEALVEAANLKLSHDQMLLLDIASDYDKSE